MRKQEFRFQTNLPSTTRRWSRSRTGTPPVCSPIRKAPSASVESIQPRPPRPCEVGRPKGRRRKSRRQSHKFFKHRRSGGHPNSPPRPGGAPHPRPPCQKTSHSDCTENCPLRRLRAPRRLRNPTFPFSRILLMMRRPPRSTLSPFPTRYRSCQCGIHTAEAASALRSRKTERAAKEKSTPISQIFFSTCRAMATTPRRWSPSESPAPAHRRNFKACFLEVTSYGRAEKPQQPCGSG